MQQERLTIQEAAHRLGVSESAIRKRIKRGTLKREKTEDGRVLVYMESTSAPGTEEVRTPDPDALISQMQARIDSLARELDVRTEEIRRRDTIIMNMTEAMKALSPPARDVPPEPRESPETGEEAPERAEPRSAASEAQDELGAERARRETAETILHEGMAEERRRREAAERERDNLRVFGRREARESSEPANEQQDRGQPHSSTGGAQGGARRPWWRRIFRN